MIFIFNPETDYALGAGTQTYTAPKGVRGLRLALTPTAASILKSGDYLMMYNAEEREECLHSEWGERCLGRGVEIITPKMAAEISRSEEPGFIEPWGWNHTLRGQLLRAGVEERMLPSDERLAALRELAHRQTTIPFNEYLNNRLHIRIPLPERYDDPQEAFARVMADRNCYIKAPWSSSGRGVAFGAGMDEQMLKSRLRSIITKQGCVLIEKGARKRLDFATEWRMQDGEALFLGLSVFSTGKEGEYSGNIIAPQRELELLIKEAAPFWREDVILAQKEALEKIVAPEYDGRAGIDMLADTEGEIWPCIEINLRYTMGHLALLQAETHRETSLSKSE